MSEFWIYLQTGLRHVLDPYGYDHLLFLIALTVPYTFKDWKRMLILISVFTVGHTLALFLSVFKVITIKTGLVEFLIPITILVAALFSLFTAGKKAKPDTVTTVTLITLFFGIIHGLGFSSYFNSILEGKPSDKLIPLLEFALGIEIGQITIVLVVLILSYMFTTVFRFSKRDWMLVMSAFVVGVVLPMILQHEIWK
jgi:hypothetical protein